MNVLIILLIILLPLIYFIDFVKKNIGVNLSIIDLITIIFTNIINLGILSLAIFIFLEYSTSLTEEINIAISFFLALYILIILLVIFLNIKYMNLPKEELRGVLKSEIIKSRLDKKIFNVFDTLKDRVSESTIHKKILNGSFIKKINGVRIIENIGIKPRTEKTNQNKIATQKREVENRPTIQNETKLDANSLFQKALELNKLGEYETSLAFLYRALHLSNGDYILQVKIYRAMATVLEDKGDNNNALFCYNKAMEISVKFLEEKHPSTRYEIACDEINRLGIEIK